jgi:MSHA biogenesis protein MshJ
VKQHWQRIAARIDEMTLRQRAMLFATISLVVIALAHALLLEPLLIRQKTLIDRSNRDQSQLQGVRAQLQSVLNAREGEAKDPEQAALQALEAKLADLEKRLASRKDGFIAPTRLPSLLKDLLGAGRRVQLEALRIVPGTAVEGGAELYRHGVEVILRGSYVELTQYLADLERLPAGLLWGSADLQVEKYPEVRLTLQVHTLSPQRALTL